jgi:uncharacterized lipoprotein YajG
MKKMLIVILVLSVAVLAGCATDQHIVQNENKSRLKTVPMNESNTDYWIQGVEVVWVNKPKKVR